MKRGEFRGVRWHRLLPLLRAGVTFANDMLSRRYLFHSGGTLEANFPGLLEDQTQSQEGPLAAPEFLTQVYPGHTCHATQVAIGYPGVGLPFHWHTDVHGNAVVAGRKRWLLSRNIPPGGFNPRQTSRAWLEQHLKGPSASRHADLWDCTLGVGEAVYVPGGFYHATISVGESVTLTYVCSKGTPGSYEVDGASQTRSDVPLAVSALPTREQQVHAVVAAVYASAAFTQTVYVCVCHTVCVCVWGGWGVVKGGGGGVDIPPRSSCRPRPNRARVPVLSGSAPPSTRGCAWCMDCCATSAGVESAASRCTRTGGRHRSAAVRLGKARTHGCRRTPPETCVDAGSK